jgi:hypothetical protein
VHEERRKREAQTLQATLKTAENATEMKESAFIAIQVWLKTKGIDYIQVQSRLSET